MNRKSAWTAKIAAVTGAVSLVYFTLGWLEPTFDIEAFSRYGLSRMHLAIPYWTVVILVPTLLFTLTAVVLAATVQGRHSHAAGEGSATRLPGSSDARLGPFARGAYTGALVAAVFGGLAMFVEGVPIGLFGTLAKLLSIAGYAVDRVLFEPLVELIAEEQSAAREGLALVRIYAAAGVSWVSWGLAGMALAKLKRTGGTST